MKEAVIEFRKLCKVLIDEKGYTIDKICAETGLSYPTYDKLIKADLSEKCGIRASTIGILQDFHKKHVDDLRYQGIEKKEPRQKKSKKLTAPVVPEVISQAAEQKTEQLLVQRDSMYVLAEILTEIQNILPFGVTINIAIERQINTKA